MNYLINTLSDFNVLGFCDSYNVLSIFYFIKNFLTLISIAVPIVLIIMMTIDVIKALMSGNINEDIKKMSGKIVKRVIMAFVFFMLPIIINLVAELIGFMNYDASMCWKNATEANIKKLKLDRDNAIKQEEQNAENESSKEEAEKEQNTTDAQNKLEDAINKKEEEEKENQSTTNSGPLNNTYSDDIVENFAAFLVGEAGSSADGIFGQLMTGAVFINNFYQLGPVKMGEEINSENLCKIFTYKKAYEGGQWNCGLTFAKLEQKRGKLTETQKHQMLTIAKILLNKKFTIPKNIQYQAAEYILRNDGAIVWGKTYTGSPAYPYIYYGCSKYMAPIATVDIYGNTVSNNFDDYGKKALELYNQYK